MSYSRPRGGHPGGLFASGSPLAPNPNGYAQPYSFMRGPAPMPPRQPMGRLRELPLPSHGVGPGVRSLREHASAMDEYVVDDVIFPVRSSSSSGTGSDSEEGDDGASQASWSSGEDADVGRGANARWNSDKESIASSVSRAPAKRRRRDFRGGTDRSARHRQPMAGKPRRGALSFLHVFLSRDDRSRGARSRVRKAAYRERARNRWGGQVGDSSRSRSSTDSEDGGWAYVESRGGAADAYDPLVMEKSKKRDRQGKAATGRREEEDEFHGGSESESESGSDLLESDDSDDAYGTCDDSPDRRPVGGREGGGCCGFCTSWKTSGSESGSSVAGRTTASSARVTASSRDSHTMRSSLPGIDEDGAAGGRHTRQVRFWHQFFANLQRMGMERKRTLLLSLSEILIPALFLVATVVAGIALKTFSYEEMQPLDYAKPIVVPLLPAPHRRFMCADPNAPRSDGRSGYPLVPALTLCSRAGFPSVSCAGDDSSLPVRGLCYTGEMEGRQVVLAYLSQVMGNLSYVPDFDTIVLYQWLARKTMGSSDDAVRQALAAAGFISNTVASVILRSGGLHFAPDSEAVKRLVEYLGNSTATFRYVYGNTFHTIDAARELVALGESLTWAIVHVKSMTPTSFDVEIQVNRTALPKLGDRIDLLYSGGFQIGRAELYFASGFLSLQKIIYNYYTERIAGVKELRQLTSGFVPYLLSMGSVPYKQSQMMLSASFIVGFITTLAFLFPVVMLSKRLVQEKELRLEEAMSIMGMGQRPRILSVFLFYLIQFLILSALLAMIVKCGFQSQSDFFIIFLVFVVYSLDCIALGFFLASFFSKTRLVLLVTPIAYFVMTVPIFAIKNASATMVFALSWMPPTALAGALKVMYQHEVNGGFRFEHFMDPLDSSKVLYQIMFMLADCVLYFLLALYLGNVLPKDCGTPKHPLFFILDPIRACRGATGKRAGGPDGRDPDGIYEDNRHIDGEYAMEVVGLRKEYKRSGKKFCAVDNLYLNFAVGGISVLLGHNGAGKSTAFNMMDGMTEPDAGDCYIYGVSVRDNLHDVRQELGFCPQHNILWPDLTCREHLEFFGKIKGLFGAPLEDAVQRILTDVDLLDKSEYRAKELSGGMKRKLSVAIAFVGGSRLILLDEPTAGMDVAARRHTWELLLRMSASRTILLTTHFMDEADLLGDYVAIMSRGRLKCAGSSLFLKSRLGVGYSLSLTVLEPTAHYQVEKLVMASVPGAESLGQKGLEVQYKLPATAVRSFPALLKAIEEDSDAYGIRGCALAATTLEEVFLTVAEEDLKNARTESGRGSTEKAADSRLEAQQDAVWYCEMLTRERDITIMQFVTSMKKRLYNARRDRRMICFQIVCPIICVLLAMLLNLISFTDTADLDLMSPYPTQTEALFSQCDDIFGFPAPSYTQQGLTTTNATFTGARDMNYYLIDSWYRHRLPGRYIAYACKDPELRRMLIAAGVAPTTNPAAPFSPLVALYNTSSEHEVAASMMHMYSSRILRKRPQNSVLETRIRTLPPTKSEEVINGGITAILIGCMIMIPFTFLPSNCVAWIVKERECKSRHLQNLSGLRFLVYWLSNFLFDIIAYMVTMSIVISIFAIFRREEFVGKDAVGPTFVVFVVYGFAGTTAAYALSFFFTHASVAQTVIMISGFASGFLLVIFVFIFNMVPATQELSRIMRWPSRLIPTYCVGEAIINMAVFDQTKLNDPTLTSWSMGVVGWPCVYMACEIPVFIFVTLFIDHPGVRMWRDRRAYNPDGAPDPASGEDTDVEEEREQTLRETAHLLDGKRHSHMTEEERDTYPDPDPVSVVHLRKVYPNGKVAVRELTFTVMPGEVFGFLGTNGAGKTTAISILCQEFLPTSGRAFICGYDSVAESREALRMLGYCPQFDATLDLLTVEEHLRVFAGVRGIVPHEHDTVIQALLDICDLREYKSVLSKELSGGNRRKLSVAMSLVGGPRVVFLDEPSAGMDPVARRGLWASISAVGQMCSIVLTTHHLEEVEALADTVTIMVNGGLRCIGTKERLKRKYGTGFEVALRIENSEVRPLVEHFMATEFPDAHLNEYRTGRFIYSLPMWTRLSDVFAILQSNKDYLGVTDYSVSQTSIEQVFMRISEEAAAAEAASILKKRGNSRSSFHL